MHVCIDTPGAAIFVIHETGYLDFVDVPWSGGQEEKLEMRSTTTTPIILQLGENKVYTVHVSGRRSVVSGYKF